MLYEVNTPLYISVILLIGLVGGKIASKAKLPSVTGYILFGLIIGPSFLDIITYDIIYKFYFINDLTLAILAFSIGTELHRSIIMKLGKTLVIVSLADNIMTFTFVALSAYILGVSLDLAIILGILAMSVSPTGVYAIVKEYRARGQFTRNVLALVAINNLVCIILFGLATAIFLGLETATIEGMDLIINLVKEIVFTIFIGAFTGLFLSLVIKRKRNSNKFLVLLLGVVLLNTGLAREMLLSALLINIVSGAVVINLTNQKSTISSNLERIEPPIFVLFLTLAGTKLNIYILSSFGFVGVVYIFGRLIGKIFGSYVGAGIASLPRKIRNNIGMALTPQAGVAIGLSIIAEQKLSSSNGIITGIVLSGVIFFEVIGPLLLKKALRNTGEIK